jgi:hypothetical protein
MGISAGFGDKFFGTILNQCAGNSYDGMSI